MKWRAKQNRFLDQWVLDKLPSLTDREFLKLHDTFFKLRYRIWQYSIMIEPFDPWGSTIIDQYFQKHNIALSSETLVVLSGSRHLTFLERERIDLLRLVQKQLRGVSIERSLLRHVQRYHWVNNSWLEVHHLDVSYFRRRVRQAVRKGKSAVTRELRQLITKEGRLRRERAAVMRQYHLPPELRTMLTRTREL